MVTVNEVPVNDLVAQVAKELKGVKEVKAPEWALFVKTGTHKQLPPTDNDWWFVRSAAVLLKVQKLGPVGVEKLRTAYGGRKNRGVKPDKFVKASGNILRKVLQQLDAAGLTKMNEKEAKKGRVITPKGVSFIYAAAKKASTAKPKPAKVEEKPVKEEKPKTSDAPAKKEKAAKAPAVKEE